MDDATTPPEVRAMVDRTVELLKRQVGPLRQGPRTHMPEQVAERLDLIRRQAEAMQRRGAH